MSEHRDDFAALRACQRDRERWDRQIWILGTNAA